MAAPEPGEHLKGQFDLPRWALEWQWFAQPGIKVSLRSPDEPFMLVEQGSHPRVVVLPEVVWDDLGPGHAIADLTIG